MWFMTQFRSDPEFAVAWIVLVVFSICCHEYMHARAALWQGDDTAMRLGHLTLNPLKQMGFVSLILLFMLGIAFGRVPVNSGRLRRPYGEAIVSFAGPFTNLVLFFVFILCAFVCILGQTESLFRMFRIGAMLNGVLFMLNMIPIPPLDGYGILCAFYPNLKQSSSEFLNGMTFFFNDGIVFFGRLSFPSQRFSQS